MGFSFTNKKNKNSMLKSKIKAFYLPLLGATLALSVCKQVALISASDSTRELASVADNGDAKASFSVGMRQSAGRRDIWDFC